MKQLLSKLANIYRVAGLEVKRHHRVPPGQLLDAAAVDAAGRRQPASVQLRAGIESSAGLQIGQVRAGEHLAGLVVGHEEGSGADRRPPSKRSLRLGSSGLGASGSVGGFGSLKYRQKFGQLAFT